jgi:hypothetical protein
MASQLIQEAASELNVFVRQSVARAKVETRTKPDMVVLHVDAMYNSPARAKELEDLLQNRLGPTIHIRVEISSQGNRRPEEPTKQLNYSERINEAARDPLVQDAMDVFGARVVRVEK